MTLTVSTTMLEDGQNCCCYVFNHDRTQIKHIRVNIKQAMDLYPERNVLDAVGELAKQKFQNYEPVNE